MSKCSLCSIQDKLSDRRFYSDHPRNNFFIVENFKTLTPILIFRNHGEEPKSLSEVVNVFSCMNNVCFKLFGKRYCLKTDQTRNHFSILCISL